jgi:DNA-binding transcriptional LysR family regulator
MQIGDCGDAFLASRSQLMLTQLRSFLAVIEEGSLHRAAARLRLSQSALSRQMQTLEYELGGRLLERSSTGVQPTNGGHALAAKMGAVLAGYDQTMEEVRRLVRGESEHLRIGYIASAAQEYLGPALAALRQSHPRVKVKLLDLSPGEQITALREGKIDLALTDHGSELLARDFYLRKLAAIPSLVVLPAAHPLAGRKEIRLAELKNETFVSGPDRDLPGYRRRLAQLCRKCGRFRPRFAGEAQSLDEGLALVANEDAVALLPAYVRHRITPCVAMIPIADAEATWEISVVWQRGRIGGPLRALLDALAWTNPEKARAAAPHP